MQPDGTWVSYWAGHPTEDPNAIDSWQEYSGNHADGYNLYPANGYQEAGSETPAQKPWKPAKRCAL